MGTRWRGMLAPIDAPTGDGRRMAKGAFRHRPTPLALKWQRSDEAGHDTSVVIGTVETITIDEDGGEVWGEGELFDDQIDLPRLTEDVREAILLTERKVIGPSVDAGSATAVLVEAGSDEPIGEERMEELFWEAMETGVDPDIEVLFTDYEIAAATLVPIPAFVEARPFVLLDPAAVTAAVIGSTDLPVAARDAEWDGDAAAGRVFEAATNADGDVDVEAVARAFLWRDDDADPTIQAAYKLGFADIIDGDLTIVPAGVAACAGSRGVDAADIPDSDRDDCRRRVCALYDRVREEHDTWPECPFGDMMAADAAVVAALTAAAPTYPAWAFADPGLAEYTELHVERRDGVDWVVGHFAPAAGCHAQFRDTCFTPPTSSTGYSLFHRTPIQVDTGELIAVGRITSGFGRVGTGCDCCPGKDDHACTELGLFDTIVHHDRLTALAYGRAGEDEHGLWFAGVVAPGLTEQGRAVLERRKFSGDWRDHGGHLELVELLGLAVGQPAFVAPRMALRSGRAFSLTAAYPAPSPGRDRPAGPGLLRTVFARALEDAIAPLRQAIGDVAARVGQDHTRQVAAAHDAVTAAEARTGAMVALRMSDDDAARLALDGGEPADELHVTLTYLGDGDSIDEATREQIVAAVRAAADTTGPIEAAGFAASAFNPTAADTETAIVLGVTGPGLTDLHQRITDVLAGMADPDRECDPDEDGDCPPAGFALPAQHTPWVPHITLAYTDDLGVVEQVAGRCGPVVFDRLRVAFAGQVTDITLTGPPEPTLADEAAALAGDALTALAVDRADALVRETTAVLAGKG